MPVEMVLTIISKDRPGLVQTLAQVIADHSGNWIDSSMARLGGEFAGILPTGCGFAVFGEGRTTRGARLRRKSMSMM